MDVDKTAITVILLVILGIAVGFPIVNTYMVQGQQVQSQFQQLTPTANGQVINLLQQDLVSGTFTLVNATCIAGENCIGNKNATLREGSEYQVSYENGYIIFVNRTGVFNASYQWEPSSYIGGAGSTVVSVIAIIFAMVILLFIVRAIFRDDE